MELLSPILLISLFAAWNLFWLPSQPASTYSLNSNNHIQIRFAVKQHPISFRNRKNENMYRKTFILIHSNRMWGYHGSCKHMVQKVNICWEPLLLRSDCRNYIFSIRVWAFLLAMTVSFNSHKNLILGRLQILIYFGFIHWIFPHQPQVTIEKKKVTTSIILIQNVLPRSEFHTLHPSKLHSPWSFLPFLYPATFALKVAGLRSHSDKRIWVSLCCRDISDKRAS